MNSRGSFWGGSSKSELDLFELRSSIWQKEMLSFSWKGSSVCFFSSNSGRLNREISGMRA
jgi:hypothetical protein